MKTIVVRRKDKDSGLLRSIEESEFDPAVHERVEEGAAAPEPQLSGEEEGDEEVLE